MVFVFNIVSGTHIGQEVTTGQLVWSTGIVVSKVKNLRLWNITFLQESWLLWLRWRYV